MGAADRLAHFAEQLRKYRGDPVAFCQNVLGVDPHPGQRKWLRDSMHPENALVTGNRYGKSFIAAAKRIYKCAYRMGWSPKIRAAMDEKHESYRSVNISFTAHQAQLVWYKAFGMLQSPRASWLVKRIKLTPFPEIEFQNGARFSARSTAREGIYLLGERFDDINWDEAAYETRFSYILDNVIRMRMVDQAGSLDYTTTGNGRNDFGQYFLTGLPGPKKDPQLYSQTGTTYDNPYVDQQRLQETAKRLSERQRKQNVLGEIVDTGGEFFPLADLMACTDDTLNELVHVHAVDDEKLPAWIELQFEHDQWWRLKYGNHRYLHGWDLADKRDWTVGTTWDLSFTPAPLVEFERFQKKGWDHVLARIRDRKRRYGGSTYVDTTGVGDVVVEALSDIGADGVNFAGGRKNELLANLQMMINGRELRWPMIMQFFDEMKFYERDDDGLIKDCVMSAAVAAWFMRRAESQVPASVYVAGRGV